MVFQTRPDILPAAQKKLWPLLAPLSGMGYCLYGGTALALRFGHRQSIDFDFFSDRLLDRILLESLPWIGDATVLQDEPGTYVVLAVPPKSRAGVKVSFFGGLKIGRVGVPERSSDGVILAASIRDLLATKLKALFDRVEPKDYLDVAEILGNGGSLLQGLSDAITLFGKSFSPAECLRILCWFNEPELVSLPDRCRQSLQASVRAAWDKPLPPSEKTGASLVI